MFLNYHVWPELSAVPKLFCTKIFFRLLLVLYSLNLFTLFQNLTDYFVTPCYDDNEVYQWPGTKLSTHRYRSMDQSLGIPDCGFLLFFWGGASAGSLTSLFHVEICQSYSP